MAPGPIRAARDRVSGYVAWVGVDSRSWLPGWTFYTARVCGDAKGHFRQKRLTDQRHQHCYTNRMIQLPAIPCVNCNAEQLQLVAAQRQYSEDTDPPLWVATTYHVQCGNCGHAFQLAVIPEAVIPETD